MPREGGFVTSMPRCVGPESSRVSRRPPHFCEECRPISLAPPKCQLIGRDGGWPRYQVQVIQEDLYFQARGYCTTRVGLDYVTPMLPSKFAEGGEKGGHGFGRILVGN